METNNTNETKPMTKGHLYFHKANGRVERITEVLNFGVVKHRHHDTEVEASLSRDFRRATREEVAAYLGR